MESLEKLIKSLKMTTRHFSAFFLRLKNCLGLDWISCKKRAIQDWKVSPRHSSTKSLSRPSAQATSLISKQKRCKICSRPCTPMSSFVNASNRQGRTSGAKMCKLFEAALSSSSIDSKRKRNVLKPKSTASLSSLAKRYQISTKRHCIILDLLCNFFSDWFDDL